MNIPENVSNLIKKLEEAGYEAYAVGGCIRDCLMKKEPEDWDICTSALPEQVKCVFHGCKIIPTGIKHGTVTVLYGKDAYEITTFRSDGEYEGHRRPKSVTFTKSVAGDLARRDFTVNAIAYNPCRGIVDPFGGLEDLEKGIIRAVGEPGKRFEEDALRILRGLRFNVSTGFEIEAGTAAAMVEKRGLLKNISVERIRDELVKSVSRGKIGPAFLRFRDIIGEIIPEMRPCFDFTQNTRHHCFDVYSHILTAVDNYAGTDPAVKIALLLHDIGKPACCRTYGGSDHFKGHPVLGVKMAEQILRRLKFDNAFIKKVKTLIRFHDVRLNGGLPQLLKITGLAGPELAAPLLDIMTADALAQSDYMREEKLALIQRGRENFALIMDKGLCYSLKQLAVGGETAAQLGFKGRERKAALHCCLNAVMNGKVENTPEALTAFLRELRSKGKI